MKILELKFDHKRLLSKQLDAALKAQREMRKNLVKEGYGIIERFRKGYTSLDECDRLDEILEDLL